MNAFTRKLALIRSINRVRRIQRLYAEFGTYYAPRKQRVKR